jgi:uncharacterized ferritin-like protein (DUF455 family)
VTGTRDGCKQVLGVTLRSDPARDPRFTVVQLPRELCEYPHGSSDWRRESLHRHFNTEVQSLETAAQSLVDFPDAPWELRLDQARQCWDESRHARLIERELVACGGFPGEFPISNYDWSVACAVGNLAGRLAVQNRTVEAGEMDLLRELRATWESLGQQSTARVMDAILADEIQHVRYANQWIKTEGRRNPMVIMQVAAAIAFVRHVTEVYAPPPDEKNQAGVAMAELNRDGFALNLEDRRLAGFSDDDLLGLKPKPAV